MKKIALTQGKFAIVDDEDYERMNRLQWCLSSKGYAASQPGSRKTRKTLLMHRLINDTPEGMDTDHINGEPLDNRKANLRSCTHAQNMANMKFNIKNTSGVRGVYWNKREKRWKAQICFLGRVMGLGAYKEKGLAVVARKRAESKYFGSFSPAELST